MPNILDQHLERTIPNYRERLAEYNRQAEQATGVVAQLFYEDPNAMLAKRIAAQQDCERKNRESTEAWRRRERDIDKGRRLEYSTMVAEGA